METIKREDDVNNVEGLLKLQSNPTIQSYGDGVSWSRGRLLGKGGFGSVFSATMKDHRISSFTMAVKSAELTRSESLKYEKKVLSNLAGCSNVIQCLGEEITTRFDGSRVYNLLLEYGSGGDLAQKMTDAGRKGLPEYDVRWYTRSILQGLIRIHGAGYAHCDLKPGNILLVSRSHKHNRFEFRAKICDFGLAKKVKIFKEKKSNTKKKLHRHAWRGTPMYLPPEAVLKEGSQETPGDIWALGCIILEMLTGRHAWDLEELKGLPASAQENMIIKLLKGGFKPKIPSELSDNARSFLRCCLKSTVKDRATAKTLLNHPFVNLNDIS